MQTPNDERVDVDARALAEVYRLLIQKVLERSALLPNTAVEQNQQECSGSDSVEGRTGKLENKG